jgi:Uma2 family endonuclease
MSQPLLEINIEHLITEDDEPVDNIISEKNQRLLTEPLYTNWSGPGEGRTYLAAANVGVFSSVHQSPIVPDAFLSLDVKLPDDWNTPENWKQKRYRSYFVWEYGKPPDLVIEIVSNKEGGENTTKILRYARMGVTYYVIFDPCKYLSNEVFIVYGLQLGRYVRLNQTYFPEIGLGLCLWDGIFEDAQFTWLRWCDRQGQVIATGKESTEAERQQTEAEKQRAEAEKQRAEKLAAKLRELGIDPDSL